MPRVVRWVSSSILRRIFSGGMRNDYGCPRVKSLDHVMPKFVPEQESSHKIKQPSLILDDGPVGQALD